MDILLIIAVVGYGCFAAGFFLAERIRRRQRGRSEAPAAKPAARSDGRDIVGRSLFKMPKASEQTAQTEPPQEDNRRQSAPNADTDDEVEEVDANDVTFAGEMPDGHSAQVPAEELDDAFADLRIEDIEGEELSEEMPPEGYAAGNTFEAIDKAVQAVRNPQATDEERREAGRIFADLQTTELFERMTERFATIGGSISEAIDYYLTSPKKEFAIPESIEQFDIRDYV